MKRDLDYYIETLTELLKEIDTLYSLDTNAGTFCQDAYDTIDELDLCCYQMERDLNDCKLDVKEGDPITGDLFDHLEFINNITAGYITDESKIKRATIKTLLDRLNNLSKDVEAVIVALEEEKKL